MKKARSNRGSSSSGQQGLALRREQNCASSGDVAVASVQPQLFEAGQTVPARVLGVSAFLLLATALVVRPLLGETYTVRASELMAPSPMWWSTSPAVMYACHLLAALGIMLGGLWVGLRRQAWRFCGLEPAVLLFVIAAAVSVPGSSDKRLAINVAVGTILPIAAAAVLYQFLAGRTVWRRALLAGLVAVGVANCWRATRQYTYEFRETAQDYQQHKAEYWAARNIRLDDPAVKMFEARLLASQPTGYFYHPNVMVSFLLLAAASAGAGICGLRGLKARREAGEQQQGRQGEWETRSNNKQQAAKQGQEGRGRDSSDRSWVLLGFAGLLAIVLWHLIVIRWVGSAGGKVGLGAGAAAGVVLWWWRARLGRAILICLAGLAVLQVALIVLGLNAGSLYPALTRHNGKIRSLAFRLAYWDGAFQLFERHPLAGVGPGQYSVDYPSVKPVYAAEEVAHPHSWLIAVAAEWGLLGLIATLSALLVPAWLLRRSPLENGQEPAYPLGPALALAWGIVLLCWLILVPGWIPSGTAMLIIETVPTVPLMLFAATLAVIGSTSRPAGRIVLLAGLVAFFVHAMVEMTSGVAGAMWPFWACMALALAWGRSGAGVQAGTLPRGQAGTRLAVLAALLGGAVVFGLSYGPVRSIRAMTQARRAWQSDPRLAERALQSAAGLDSLDPQPCVALGELYQTMAHAQPDRQDAYVAQAVQAFDVAVRRDPRSNVHWHDLGMVKAQLAAMRNDANLARQAIADSERAVQLYPASPQAHRDLAMVLIEAGKPPEVQPQLLRRALSQIDKALELDKSWPAEDPRRFQSRDLTKLQDMKTTLMRWLRESTASSSKMSLPSSPG